MRNGRHSGSTLPEFILLAIPMIFVLVSTFEVSRLAWNYHTLTAAVGEAARFAVIQEKNCHHPPNSCAVTVGEVAAHLRTRAAGLDPKDMRVTFVSNAGSITCRLDQCIGNAAAWPPPQANKPGTEIRIAASHSIESMMAMNWSAGTSVRPFGSLHLQASSREAIPY